MHFSIHINRAAGFLLAILLLLTISVPVAAISLDETPIRQARLYEKQGNYQQASDMYLLTANKLPASEGEKWKVKAAEMAWLAGNSAQASRILDNVDESHLDHVTLIHGRLVAARIARSQGNYAAVLEKLNFPSHSAPAKLQRTISALLDEAREKVGFQRPADTQPKRGLPLPRPGALSGAVANSGAWSKLMALSTQDLSKRLAQPLSPLEKGWTELAYIAKTTADSPEALENQLTRWEQEYRNHPAYPDYVNALRPGAKAQYGSPLSAQVGRVAVLLPTSGPLARVANVILEGIMAAKYQRPDTAIKVYDSAQGNIIEHYRQAVAEGAELVIGPMDKGQVDELASEQLPVPVISLNHGKNPTLANANLFQFALLPEDEARQAARQMLADGHSRVAAVAPKGIWGDRILRALEETLRQGGGELVAVGRFKARSNDHSNVIKRALKPDPKTHVNRVDAQAVFIAAGPQEARLLMPLIKFHFIDSLPAYAISHVWSGYPDRSANRDLNRLSLTEIPWLLGYAPDNAPKPSDLGETARHHPRLFAFGYDALATAPKLIQSAGSAAKVPGLSGILTLDERNRIHRSLGWARFSRGQAKPLHPPRVMPAMDYGNGDADASPSPQPAIAPAPELGKQPALHAIPFDE